MRKLLRHQKSTSAMTAGFISASYFIYRQQEMQAILISVPQKSDQNIRPDGKISAENSGAGSGAGDITGIEATESHRPEKPGNLSRRSTLNSIHRQ